MPERERESTGGGAALSEALGYVAAWRGRRVVIKFGGRAMAAGSAGTLLSDITLLRRSGIDPILVHGGGPEITDTLEKLGLEAKFLDGLRVTDAETMRVVEMVLAGHVNKRLVGELQQLGGAAAGLSGKDGGMLRVTPHPKTELGFVGDIAEVDTSILDALIASEFIPVVASLGVDRNGATYNVNADTAASALAVAVGAEKLLLLTDVAGVKDKAGDLVSESSPAEAVALIEDGVVSAGMIPKVEACLHAINNGVHSGHIIEASRPHGLLSELFTEEGIGTMIRSGSAAMENGESDS